MTRDSKRTPRGHCGQGLGDAPVSVRAVPLGLALLAVAVGPRVCFSAPPVAVAGPDRNVQVLEVVQLDGSGSSDPDNDEITQWEWTFDNKPAGSTATLRDASSAAAWFVPDLRGNYVVALRVYAGGAWSDPDTPALTAARVLLVTEYRLTTETDNEYVPTISGATVVYTHIIPAPEVGDAELYRCTVGGQPEPLVTGSGNQFDSDLSGTSVVYTNDVTGRHDVWFYDWVTQENYKITASIMTDNEPAISGNNIVYTTMRNYNYDIYWFNTLTKLEVPLANTSNTERYAAIDGELVAWVVGEGGNYNIRARYLEQPDFPVATTAATEMYPSVSGGRIAYLLDTDVVVFDTATGLTTRVTEDGYTQAAVKIAGNLVWFTDNRNVYDSYDLFLHELSSGVTYQIIDNPSVQNLTDADGNRAVFYDNRYGSNDIFVVEVAYNQPPIANAGPDQQVAPDSSVQLDGAGSFDPEGEPIADYLWTLVSKPAGSTAVLSDAHSPTPTFVADLPCEYALSLVVFDGDLWSAADSVVVWASTSPDCNANRVPDGCEPPEANPDCDGVGGVDECEASPRNIYVNGVNGDDTWTGSVETIPSSGRCGPKKTIQAGIDAARDGDTVLIADGTYMGTGNKNLDFHGKAITVRSQSGNAAGCIIDCENSGRGFHFHSGETTASVVDGLTVTGGLAAWGGGCYCDQSSPTLTNCTFLENSADLGGGINLNVGSPTVRNCQFLGNSATQHGGGLLVSVLTSTTVTNSTFSGNSAGGNGAGIWNGGGNLVLASCVFNSNTASGRGGGLDTLGSSEILNCTFSDNHAVDGGGIWSGSSTMLSNCILWANSGGEIHNEGSFAVTFSDVQDGYIGEGNIAIDPQFVDPDGPDNNASTWEDNDYHLLPTSPCINAGDPAFTGLGETDIDDEPRVQDGRVDMGADERHSPPPPCSGHELAKLLAGDGEAGGALGHAVALSGDVAVVGAPYDDDQGQNAGAVYVFRRTGGQWTQEAKLTASNGSADSEFGAAVAIDGDTIIVGAPKWSTLGKAYGAAYAFTYDSPSGQWNEAAILDTGSYPSGQENEFGNAVAISGDVAVVGAWKDDEAFADWGAAYVYRRSGEGAWSPLPKDKLIKEYEQWRGGGIAFSVAVSGETVVLGAPMWGSYNPGVDPVIWGQAFVFEFEEPDPPGGGSWVYRGALEPPTQAHGLSFGWSVAISGNTILAGAPGYAGGGVNVGAAYCFAKPAGGWPAKMTGTDPLLAHDGATNDSFGQSVDIDASLAVIGAWRILEDGPGKAYLFRNIDGAWFEQVTYTTSGAAIDDHFAHAVAISGETVLVGAYGDNADAGAAYVFGGLSDCDGNDVSDICDLAYCSGDPACADCNANRVPDGCEPPEANPDCDGVGGVDECQASPRNIYVNGVNGDDAWTGSVETIPSSGRCGPKKTIQAGIDAARDGDTVLIADGTYMGTGNKNLDFHGKAITVRSQSGNAAGCIIDCQNSGRGFYFHSGETTTSVVGGLTIQYGHESSGGGVYCSGSGPLITRCVIRSNTAINGGGVYCSNASGVTITNCTIIGNSAESPGRGGGVRLANTDGAQIRDCIVAGNMGGFGGGGVACQAGSLSLSNSTIAACVSASGSGNALQADLSTGGSADVANCILWNGGNEIELTGSGLTVAYSDVQDGYIGAGNINADPQFVDPDGADNNPSTWEDNDYHLSPVSPCINAGDPNGGYTGQTDIDGEPRVQAGRVDMGADEWHARGACCLAGSGCQELAEPVCAQAGGAWLGPGTLCNAPQSLTSDFGPASAGYTLYGSAAIMNEAVRLTPSQPSTYGNVAFDDVLPPVTWFSAEFDFRMNSGSGPPWGGADGLSFSLAPAGYDVSQWIGEAGVTSGLAVSFDTFDADNPGVDAIFAWNNGGGVLSQVSPFELNNGTWYHVKIDLVFNRLTIVITPQGGAPQTICQNLLLPEYEPFEARPVWAARTGGAWQEHWVDNVAVSAGTTGDCNANGVPDECDIAGGTSLDCNDNSLPDECDLAAGTSQDCNTNGVPDECDLAGEFVYQWDDETREYFVESPAPYGVAINHFVVQPGHGRIRRVGIVWCDTSPGLATDVYLWSDPNGDGNPNDAQVLAGASIWSGSMDQTTFVDLPETNVGLPGTSFFVGIIAQGEPNSRRACLDSSSSQQQSWWGLHYAPPDPNQLAAMLYPPALLSSITPGNFMLRAVTVVEDRDCNDNLIPDVCDIANCTDNPACKDCNQNGIPDACDIAAGTSRDCNHNGVPDECDLAGGASTDCQPDGIPDECQAPPPHSVDSVADFSGVQGQRGWYHGYYNRTTDGDGIYQPNDFIQFPADYWNGAAWVWPAPRQPPWTYLGALDVHPNGANNGDEHWPIRRWVSDRDATATISGQLRKTNLYCGDGVIGRLFVNGAETWSGVVAYDDTVGIEFQVQTVVTYGSTLDFTLAPGSTDSCDGSAFSATVALNVPGDCNANGVPDACDIADCNGDPACGDCNTNGVPDECDIAGGTSRDCNHNGVPDECEVISGTVANRIVFYNHSWFDGNDPAPNAADDAAIATDKTALLPGQTASLSNYTSYSRGINGIMVDMSCLQATPSLSDFEFHVGNTTDPATWSAAPMPSSLTVRPGAGVGGSDRITIIWPDGAITKQWLRVKIEADTTGLEQDDVFYFGNAVGEGCNSSQNTFVDGTDIAAARDNPHGVMNPALVDDLYDYDKDRYVKLTDMFVAQSSFADFITAVKLFVAPSESPQPPGAPEPQKAGQPSGRRGEPTPLVLIDAGAHCLLAGRSDQIVRVFVSSTSPDAPPVSGFNLRAQLGDGDGADLEPLFASVDFAGGIWDGPETIAVGGVATGHPKYAQASVVFKQTGQSVAADGLVATLIVDTTGFTAGETFDLKLSATDIGQTSDFILSGDQVVEPTIANGTITLVTALAPVDFDTDCDVDSKDLEVFESCATGPAITGPPAGCTPEQFDKADVDDDTDVDQTDFAQFQRCYSGEDVPADPNCGT